MGLEISRISNKELKKLAYNTDKDGNGKLNDREITVFKRKAKKYEDFAKTMDELYMTSPINGATSTAYTTSENDTSVREEVAVEKEATVEEVAVEEEVASAEKKEQNAIRNDIDAIIDGNKRARLRADSKVSLDNLVAILEQKNTNKKYQAAISEVDAVVQFVKSQEVDSKEDVEALDKKIRKNDEFNKFQKSLAKDIVELAKRDQINKEAKVLIGYYNEIRSNEEEGTKPNFTEYLKQVEDRMKDENLAGQSYYSNEAFDILKEIARQDVLNMNNEYRQLMIENDSTNVTKKDVKNELLDKYDSDDKFARKIIKNDEVENARISRWLDRDRTAEDLESISEEVLKDELGEELFDILDKNYLHETKNNDGTYNLKDLSDKLFDRVGYDVWMNLSDDTEMSELQGAKKELKFLTGRDLNDKDIKKILKLVHIEREPKDRNLLGALGNSIIPAIAGAIVGASTYTGVDVNQRVVLSLDAGMPATDELLSALKSAGTEFTKANGANGKIQIIIEQSVLVNQRALAALAGVGIGALAGVLMNLIFGMENKEESCVSIAEFDLNDERYTNSEKYKNYIDETQSKAKANILKALVDVFVAEYGEENWAKEYDSMLKKFAGKGSVLNCLELKGGYLNNVTKASIENTGSVQIHTGEQEATEGSYVDLNIPTIDARTSSWSKLAEQYECLGDIQVDPATHPNCYRRRSQLAVRILKVAQAINDGNYSAERLLDLAEKTFASPNNRYEALKDYPGIDHDVLVGTMNAQLMGDKVKMPDTLAGCNRVEKDIKAKVKDKSGKIAAVDSAKDKKFIPGVDGKYGYRINGGEIIQCENQADLNEKVQAESDKARQEGKSVIIEKLINYEELENMVA